MALEWVSERPDIPRPVVRLLFWAAFNASVGDFRVHGFAISLVGVVLVLVTSAAVAWGAHAVVPSVPWAVAVVLGAIIVAPPDVVVTMSMLRGLAPTNRQ